MQELFFFLFLRSSPFTRWPSQIEMCKRIYFAAYGNDKQLYAY